MAKHIIKNYGHNLHLLLIVASFSLALIFIGLGISQDVAAFEGGMPAGAAAARGDEQPADLFGLSGTFTTITNVLLFLVGAISVIMIIIGGLRYVLSGGDSANITAAKNTILYAIIGIIVSLLAYAAVNFVVGSFAEGSSGGIGNSTGGSSSGATNF